MIVVRVELHSAIDGAVTELARMHICDDGTGSNQICTYNVRTLRGRSTEQLNRNTPQRTGTLENWPRLRRHMWVMVLAALLSCGYHKDLLKQ